MSIEERARTAHIRSSVTPLTITSAHAVGYIQGATEQHQLDTEKACEWLTDYFVFKHEAMSGQGCNAFLEEFRSAMKGE